MASSFLTRFRSGPYLRNEQGVQKYSEMALGQLVRTVARKSRFYREQSENLLVEKANLRQRLLTDPHSPSQQRASVVRNLDPWYAAYQPKPTQRLYLAPEQRVRIW